MFTHCVFCHAALPKNDAVERFPIGRRIAFDPARGRLWAVCANCQRWNLAPIEQRWEALEDLERLAHDRGRLLASTEHIALVHAPGVDLVRVGRAELAEESWWRYGSELRRRHSRYNNILTAEWIIALAAFPLFGMGLFGGGSDLNRYARWKKFGGTAWRGTRNCAHCGHALTQLAFNRTADLRLDTSGDALKLLLRCTQCGTVEPDAGFHFDGSEAERLLRRVLAWHNFAGANESGVHTAVRLIDQAGSASALVGGLREQRFRIGDREKRPDLALALEIAVNHNAERELLELELSELEARWREEERIAGIADGELTELPLLAKLRRQLAR